MMIDIRRNALRLLCPTRAENMKTTSSLIALCLLLGGCPSHDTGTNQSPLVGAWISDSCEQSFDSSGSPVNAWIRSLYEFTSQGTIRLGREEYADANCVTLHGSVAPVELDVPVMYVDKGPQALLEGIEGAGLVIEMGSGEQLLSVEAYYTINGGKLCLSDAFTFEALRFGISESGNDAIDFSHCLIRP